MSSQKINTRTIVLILMMLVASFGRLISYEFQHSLSNFTPLGAIALFGGAYFKDKWKAYLVVGATLFLSDMFINYLYTSKLVLWYSGSIWVYLPFFLMVFIGSLIKKINVVNVGLSSFITVSIHWLISDLPWFYGDRYPHNLFGYLQSLFQAIPFEANMLAANLLFGIILFGGFEFAKNKYNILHTQRKAAI